MIELNTLKSLKSIGNKAFAETGMTELNASNCTNLTSISEYAFCANTKLVTANFQNTPITVLNSGLFSGNKLMETCDIDWNLITKIGNTTFYNCESLAIALNIPNLTTIGVGAFYSSGIIKIIDLGSIQKIENDDFFHCESLTDVKIPTTVLQFGSNAFCGCSAINTLNCDWTKITSIGSAAFAAASSTTKPANIDIETHVLEILNQSAFSQCGFIRNFDCSNSPLVSIGYAKQTGTESYGVFRRSTIKKANFSNCASLVNIGGYTFFNCVMTDIDFTNCTSIKNIWYNAFGQLCFKDESGNDVLDYDFKIADGAIKNISKYAFNHFGNTKLTLNLADDCEIHNESFRNFPKNVIVRTYNDTCTITFTGGIPSNYDTNPRPFTSNSGDGTMIFATNTIINMPISWQNSIINKAIELEDASTDGNINWWCCSNSKGTTTTGGSTGDKICTCAPFYIDMNSSSATFHNVQVNFV